MTMRPLIVALFLALASTGANAAVQPPPKNCVLPTGVLGTDPTGKWICQPPAPVLQGPQGIPGPPGSTGAVTAYNATNPLVPGTWYGIYGTANVVIPLPTPGTAPFVNPAKFCFTNYGTGTLGFTVPTGVPLYGVPSSIIQNGSVCIGVDDQTPTGWRGDGGQGASLTPPMDALQTLVAGMPKDSWLALTTGPPQNDVPVFTRASSDADNTWASDASAASAMCCQGSTLWNSYIHPPIKVSPHPEICLQGGGHVATLDSGIYCHDPVACAIAIKANNPNDPACHWALKVKSARYTRPWNGTSFGAPSWSCQTTQDFSNNQGHATVTHGSPVVTLVSGTVPWGPYQGSDFWGPGITPGSQVLSVSGLAVTLTLPAIADETNSPVYYNSNTSSDVMFSRAGTTAAGNINVTLGPNVYGLVHGISVSGPTIAPDTTLVVPFANLMQEMAGSPNVTVDSISQLTVGADIWGGGIQPGTTIAALSGTTVTLSKPALSNVGPNQYTLYSDFGPNQLHLSQPATGTQTLGEIYFGDYFASTNADGIQMGPALHPYASNFALGGSLWMMGGGGFGGTSGALGGTPGVFDDSKPVGDPASYVQVDTPPHCFAALPGQFPALSFGNSLYDPNDGNLYQAVGSQLRRWVNPLVVKSYTVIGTNSAINLGGGQKNLILDPDPIAGPGHRALFADSGGPFVLWSDIEGASPTAIVGTYSPAPTFPGTQTDAFCSDGQYIYEWHGTKDIIRITPNNTATWSWAPLSVNPTGAIPTQGADQNLSMGCLPYGGLLTYDSGNVRVYKQP